MHVYQTKCVCAGAGFECLAEDVGEVMGLFVEVLKTPALPQAKIDLYKSQVQRAPSTAVPSW